MLIYMHLYFLPEFENLSSIRVSNSTKFVIMKALHKILTKQYKTLKRIIRIHSYVNNSSKNIFICISMVSLSIIRNFNIFDIRIFFLCTQLKLEKSDSLSQYLTYSYKSEYSILYKCTYESSNLKH